MNVSNHVRINVRLLRVKEWYFHLGFILLGMVFAGEKFAISGTNFVLGMVLGALYLGGGYAFNAACDEPTMKAQDLIFSNGLLIIFVALSCYSVPHCALWFVIAIIGHFFYAHPFFLLRKNHTYSVFINALSFSLLFLMGVELQSQTISLRAFAMFSYFFLIMSAYQLMHAIAHFDQEHISFTPKRLYQYCGEIVLVLSVAMGFAYMLYKYLALGFLFLFSSLLFLSAFLMIIMLLLRKKTFEHKSAYRARMITRYLGIFYGIALLFAFVW